MRNILKPPIKTKRINFLVLYVVLLMILPGLGAEEKPGSEVQRTIKLWKSSPERIKINDQLSYIFQHDSTTQITVIQLAVKGGTRAIPVIRRGLMFLTLNLSFDMQTYIDLIEFTQMGSSIHYSVEGDFCVVTIQGLTKHIDNTLKILMGIFRDPLFSSLRIDSTLDFMSLQQKSEEESLENLMQYSLLNAFYGKQDYSYAGSIFGDTESRKKIGRKDALQLYKARFNLSNMCIAVSSDLSREETTKLIEKHFKNIPVGTPLQDETFRMSVPESKSIFIKKENQQVLISFGVLLPGINMENYTRVSLLKSLMGKGIGSRLWQLRLEKELTYNINAHFLQMKDSGIFFMYIKTDTSKKEEAYRAFRKIITETAKNGVSPEELKMTASFTEAEYLRQNETKPERMFNIAMFESLGVGYEFPGLLFSSIEREGIEVEKFNKWLGEIFQPEKLIEVIIGPEDLKRVPD